MYHDLRISSDKASNLPKRDARFFFVEITTGETRHIQQIYVDEPSMHHCPQLVYLKRGFLHACDNYFSLNDNLFRSSTVLVFQ